MNQQLLLGVDIGTTGCRAVLYRKDGTQVASASLEYPLYTPEANWAEQDPEEIYQAFIKVVRRAVTSSGGLESQIAGMCFSTVMHGVIPVDKNGTALHRMMIWADSRSITYAETAKQAGESKTIYQKTGCPVHPMYPFYKIMWLKTELPDIFSRTFKFIGIKEYILFRLLGKYLIDKSLASATSIYNIHELAWDQELLTKLGITEKQLPDVVSTTHIEQGLQREAAALLGLPVQTPVIIGASDGILSTVGSGAVNPGQVTAMIGTSGAVRVVTDKPRIDSKGRIWCYNLTDEYWVLGGALNNGGIALRWLRDKFAETEQRVAEKMGLDTYEILSSYASRVPAGSDGLILLPFFAGERAPYYNADTRGVFFGLNLNHGKHHMIRATLEGIIYRMFSVFEALEQVSGNATEIRVGGSFTRSNLWVQIMADVFGRVITVPGEPQGSAFGAAVLGFHALGILKDIKEVGSYINIQARYHPNSENHAHYQELYAIYKRLYWNLQEEFHSLSEIQRRIPK